jgi:hypothetical protein
VLCKCLHISCLLAFLSFPTYFCELKIVRFIRSEVSATEAIRILLCISLKNCTDTNSTLVNVISVNSAIDVSDSADQWLSEIQYGEPQVLTGTFSLSLRLFSRYGFTDRYISVFISFGAVAVWSSVPLTVRLFVTLKRHRGIYFWAILVTSWGLSIREIGYILQFLVPSSPWLLYNILAQAGWVAMVSGFAIVLYSRLNLILESRVIRRRILTMIVLNACILHPAMITLSIGMAALARTKNPTIRHWKSVFNIMERIQIVAFLSQEAIISFFYMRAAYQYLRSRFVQRGKTRKIMSFLLGVQLVVVIVDLAIIVIDFVGFLELKLFLHSFIYSVKLELEFLVLTQLVELSQLGVPGLPSFSLDKSERRNDSKSPLAPHVVDWTPTQSPMSDSLSFESSRRPSQATRRSSLMPRSNSVLDQIPETHAVHSEQLSLDRIGVIPDV